MRLLVTGGTGLLGHALLPRAEAAGHRVWATHLTGRPYCHVGWRRLDLRDRGAATQFLMQSRPDAVIHAAAVAAGPDMQDVNCRASEEIALACHEVGARLLHLSCDLVFRGRPGGKYKEDDRTSPLNDFGKSKAQAEARVLVAHEDTLVIRTSLLYGGAEPGPHERIVDGGGGQFLADEIRTPTSVADLAEAVLELLPSSQRGILHVAGDDAMSRLEFARLLAAARGVPPEGFRAPDKDKISGKPGFTRTGDCGLVSRKAATLLQTRLRGAREVLSGSQISF